MAGQTNQHRDAHYAIVTALSCNRQPLDIDFDELASKLGLESAEWAKATLRAALELDPDGLGKSAFLHYVQPDGGPHFSTYGRYNPPYPSRPPPVKKKQDVKAVDSNGDGAKAQDEKKGSEITGSS